MSSTYNARPLAAAVMVSGTVDAVIRQRQSFEAMRAGDVLPPWLGPLLPPPQNAASAGASAAKPAAREGAAREARPGGSEGSTGGGFWRFWFGR
jgi:hypothetical protein